MKLETKYGVLEGTVEEFKELLEGKKDLSYFSGEAEEDIKPTYKIVNKDTIDYNSGVRIFKGIVLEHTSRDWYTTKSMYTDTVGNLYELHESDLDDYNMSWVDAKFKSFKDKDLLLIQKEEDKYKVVKEDIYFPMDGNSVLEKGTVLIEGSINSYKDSLGNTYRLSLDTIEDKLEGVYGSVGLRFEEHKLNNKLYKVELP
ncbi:hypothetical protein HOR18_gp203 [Staphylococcus phage vB_SscM-1]|uniref:Uncharacterized protein n=2 Tax=Sciuriunavirus SscM1 TaxID=2734053 RepID=A0A1X9IA18_9CAUD|nr:hypothetical protein HOR18_gp203 [Staphylococcus phage vB_SscM-1]ANT44866.1 hypothetical protein vB_SscM-1_202 [Staphylococcus phage vB_SscM-1]ANT45068.1 hypothetical protein vB_SscM-2_201 [Staphylococcus phage vB_SscM-2]